MRVTSVLGHIKSYDFPESYKNWKSTPLTVLYTAPLQKSISENSKDVVNNIKEACKGVNKLILWLDCDREGEAIAFDVIDVCKEANRNLTVFRARFSTVTAADIEHACQNVVEPNKCLSDAVNIRQEVDLRIGASFTRFQTLLVQEMFPKKYGVVSYGPCQFPTLGFIVERYQAIRDFVPEKFNYLDCRFEREINEPGRGKKKCMVKFEWDRGRLFDEFTTLVLYESCIELSAAKVTKVEKKVTSKRRPYPLNTIELQKTASRKLFLAGHKIMEIAEKLYNKGLISYPRTETSRYSPNIDIKDLIKRQVGSGTWGDFAQRLANNDAGLFKGPLFGKGDDKAHPPIHPVKLVSGDLPSDEWKVYEFVVRHFLATVAKDATGDETTVHVKIGSKNSCFCYSLTFNN